jgi:hypothetical protein
MLDRDAKEDVFLDNLLIYEIEHHHIKCADVAPSVLNDAVLWEEGGGASVDEDVVFFSAPRGSLYMGYRPPRWGMLVSDSSEMRATVARASMPTTTCGTICLTVASDLAASDAAERMALKEQCEKGHDDGRYGKRSSTFCCFQWACTAVFSLWFAQARVLLR